MEQIQRRSIIARAVREALLAEDPEAVTKLRSKDVSVTINLFGKSHTLEEAEKAVAKLYHSIGFAINLYDTIAEIDTINAIDDMIEAGEICLPEANPEQEEPAVLPVRSLDRFNQPFPFRNLDRN